MCVWTRFTACSHSQMSLAFLGQSINIQSTFNQHSINFKHFEAVRSSCTCSVVIAFRQPRISLNAALAAHSERWQKALQAFVAASADAYGFLASPAVRPMVFLPVLSQGCRVAPFDHPMIATHSRSATLTGCKESPQGATLFRVHAGKHPLGFMQAQFWQVSRLRFF